VFTAFKIEQPSYLCLVKIHYPLIEFEVREIERLLADEAKYFTLNFVVFVVLSYSN
jgi:hypothetical protein